MFTIIGLICGAFLGYLASGFLDGLDPLRDSAKQGIGKGLALGSNLLSNLTKSFGQGPLINIGILIIVVLLLIWLTGFTTAMLIGFIGGVIYTDEVGKLPFVSGVASSIRQKLTGHLNSNKDINKGE